MIRGFGGGERRRLGNEGSDEDESRDDDLSHLLPPAEPEVYIRVRQRGCRICGEATRDPADSHRSGRRAGQDVGVRQVSDRICLVSFMDYDLGYFDDEECRLEPIENPFSPKVLPMSPERTVTHVPGMDPLGNGAPGRTRTCAPPA